VFHTVKYFVKHKINKYEQLLKFSEITMSSHEFASIRKIAISKLKKLLDCKQIIIFLRDGEKLLYKNSFGEDISCSIKENTFVGESAFYQATLHIKEPSSDIRFAKLPKEIRSLKINNLLMAPLVSKGELLGVIQAVNSKHNDFNNDDIKYLEMAAGYLTIAFENSKLINQLQNQFIQVVETLSDAIGKKDQYTGGHTKRVAHFAEQIGNAMELSTTEMHKLKLAAYLHDIGKIGIEDKILKKKEPLTEAEFQIMKNHPRFGDEILGHIDEFQEVIDGVRFHHERPDGKGYPYGLKADEIPLISMIISVADSFDAMISNRPYRKGLPPMDAYEEILKYSGTQFSKNVVDAFAKSFEKSTMYKSILAKYKKAG